MFKPVIGVLDIENVFRDELESDEDRARMRAVRVMLRDKYLLGCEITYTHRILVNKKVRAYLQTTRRANGHRMRASISGLRILRIALSHLLPSRLRICPSSRSFLQRPHPHRQQSGQRRYSTSRSVMIW
jgi:hypothetical protein